MNLGEILSLPEMEQIARGCMSTMAYEYVSAAAADEHTARWNRESYDRMRLRPRVLRDIAKADTRVNLLGHQLAAPVVLAPAAYQRLMHADGELGMAKGAGAA